MKIFILTSVYIQSYKYKTVMKKLNLYEKHISKVLRLNLLVFKSSHLEKKYLKLKFSVWNMAVPLFIILGNISRYIIKWLTIIMLVTVVFIYM